jgi:ketosteroid isomerase-like protein
MKRFATKCFANSRVWLILLLFVLAAATSVSAQKKDKKSNQQPIADSPTSSAPLMPVSDSEAVDRAIGEALGYWQIGDVDSLHKYYSDDVVVISGLWEPPVIGWPNYLKAYQDQRAHVTGGRMERSNTLIKVSGNSAWATYQFIYVVMVQDKVAQFRGHTTLILNKQGDRWVIVMNHSSIVDSTYPTEAAPAPAVAPAGHS